MTTMQSKVLKSINIQLININNAGFILEHAFAEFPQFEKKCRIKFAMVRKMGCTKLRPGISTGTYVLKSSIQKHH